MYSWIITFLFLIKFTPIFIHSEKCNLRLRNYLLRIYIASNENKIKLINEYSKQIVQKTKNKIISKYHQISSFYNNLSDDEKEIINFVVSLLY